MQCHAMSCSVLACNVRYCNAMQCLFSQIFWYRFRQFVGHVFSQLCGHVKHVEWRYIFWHISWHLCPWNCQSHWLQRGTQSQQASLPSDVWKSRSGWHWESASLPWDEAERRRRYKEEVSPNKWGRNWKDLLHLAAAVLRANSATRQVHHWHTSSRPPPGCSQLTLLLIGSALALQAHQAEEPVQLCSHFRNTIVVATRTPRNQGKSPTLKANWVRIECSMRWHLQITKIGWSSIGDKGNFWIPASSLHQMGRSNDMCHMVLRPLGCHAGLGWPPFCPLGKVCKRWWQS